MKPTPLSVAPENPARLADSVLTAEEVGRLIRAIATAACVTVGAVAALWLNLHDAQADTKAEIALINARLDAIGAAVGVPPGLQAKPSGAVPTRNR